MNVCFFLIFARTILALDFSGNSFSVEYNQRISKDEYLYETESGVSMISCADKCSVEINCYVAYFDTNSETCFLHMSGGCNSEQQYEQGWISIRREQGTGFNWSPWSKCSNTCGGGKRTRSHQNVNVESTENVTSVEACHCFGCNDTALNCNEWKSKGLVDSQTVLIEPVTYNGVKLQAVEVYCYMENGVGVTKINHNGERNITVVGYEALGSYSYIVTYNISFEHVVAIIDSSQFCRQFVRWSCKGALIWDTLNDEWTTYWTNRSTAYLATNEKKPPSGFFHGTEVRRTCECGISQTCQESNVLCNCDINDGIWRSDEGYVTNKDALPIVAFFAGDTGDSGEEGHHFIGPLECYGTA